MQQTLYSNWMLMQLFMLVTQSSSNLVKAWESASRNAENLAKRREKKPKYE